MKNNNKCLVCDRKKCICRDATLTKDQIGMVAFELTEFLDIIEARLDSFPMDYGDRKDCFENLIVSILDPNGKEHKKYYKDLLAE